jgi:hypothetical protein
MYPRCAQKSALALSFGAGLVRPWVTTHQGVETMSFQTENGTRVTQVPNVIRTATAAARGVVAPVNQARVPYARALYAAAVAALLAACTPSERASAPEMALERIGTVAATVDSAALGDELPVVVIRASRELPEIVVTASRTQSESMG